MSKPALIVMAAGMGNRYGGLKQVDPVGPSGELLMDYSIYDALRAGFGKIIFVIRRDFEEEFRSRIGRRIGEKTDTSYVFQELDNIPAGPAVPDNRKKPWGTGHAVLCARREVPGNFAVINADDFYGAGAFVLLSDYLSDATGRPGTGNYCIVCYTLENTLSDHGHVSRGVCTLKNGNLDTITEIKKIRKGEDGVFFMDPKTEEWISMDPGSMVSMNIFGYTPDFYDELEARFKSFIAANRNNPDSEFYLPLVTGELVTEGRAEVKALPTTEKWLGVTYREDRPEVEKGIAGLVKSGVYPEKLWG